MTNEIKDYMNRHITTMVKGMLDKVTDYCHIGSSEDYGQMVVGSFVKAEHKRDLTASGDARIEKQALDLARKLALEGLKKAIKAGRWLSIRNEIGEFDKRMVVVDEAGREVVSIALY